MKKNPRWRYKKSWFERDYISPIDLLLLAGAVVALIILVVIWLDGLRII